MNQKQPSSGDRTKPRTLLKFVIPTAGLILAFCSMLSFTTCSAKYPSLFPWKPSIAELDRKAKPHFDQAKKEIPQIARNLSTVSSVTRLCWYMATDKAALEKYLTEQLQPMIRVVMKYRIPHQRSGQGEIRFQIRIPTKHSRKL